MIDNKFSFLNGNQKIVYIGDDKLTAKSIFDITKLMFKSNK